MLACRTWCGRALPALFTLPARLSRLAGVPCLALLSGLPLRTLLPSLSLRSSLPLLRRWVCGATDNKHG